MRTLMGVLFFLSLPWILLLVGIPVVMALMEVGPIVLICAVPLLALGAILRRG